MIPDCHLCSRPSKSWGSLVKHAAQTHKVVAEDYFKSYIGTKTTCVHCNSLNTKFLSISEGYSKNCPACESTQRKLSAKLMRARLANDPKKYDSFIEKLSFSVKKTYKDRRVLKRGIISDELLNSSIYEPHWRKLALTMKMDLDYSKPTSTQITSVVEKNLINILGIKNGC
jgi:hypothetical protein